MKNPYTQKIVLLAPLLTWTAFYFKYSIIDSVDVERNHFAPMYSQRVATVPSFFRYVWSMRHWCQFFRFRKIIFWHFLSCHTFGVGLPSWNVPVVPHSQRGAEQVFNVPNEGSSCMNTFKFGNEKIVSLLPDINASRYMVYTSTNEQSRF